MQEDVDSLKDILEQEKEGDLCWIILYLLFVLFFLLTSAILHKLVQQMPAINLSCDLWNPQRDMHSESAIPSLEWQEN